MSINSLKNHKFNKVVIFIGVYGMYEKPSLDDLEREAREFAKRYKTSIDGISEATKKLEGPDFGMFAAITGFNRNSYRKSEK